MKVRKFFAPSSREALRLVREALGADAVVLSNRVVDGGVELVALTEETLTDMVDEPQQPAAAFAAPTPMGFGQQAHMQPKVGQSHAPQTSHHTLHQDVQSHLNPEYSDDRWPEHGAEHNGQRPAARSPLDRPSWAARDTSGWEQDRQDDRQRQRQRQSEHDRERMAALERQRERMERRDAGISGRAEPADRSVRGERSVGIPTRDGASSGASAASGMPSRTLRPLPPRDRTIALPGVLAAGNIGDDGGASALAYVHRAAQTAQQQRRVAAQAEQNAQAARHAEMPLVGGRAQMSTPPMSVPVNTAAPAPLAHAPEAPRMAAPVQRPYNNLSMYGDVGAEQDDDSDDALDALPSHPAPSYPQSGFYGTAGGTDDEHDGFDDAQSSDAEDDADVVWRGSAATGATGSTGSAIPPSAALESRAAIDGLQAPSASRAAFAPLEVPAASAPVQPPASPSLLSRVFSRPSFRERAGVAESGVTGLVRPEKRDDEASVLGLVRAERSSDRTPPPLTASAATARGLGSVSNNIVVRPAAMPDEQVAARQMPTPAPAFAPASAALAPEAEAMIDSPHVNADTAVAESAAVESVEPVAPVVEFSAPVHEVPEAESMAAAPVAAAPDVTNVVSEMPVASAPAAPVSSAASAVTPPSTASAAPSFGSASYSAQTRMKGGALIQTVEMSLPFLGMASAVAAASAPSVPLAAERVSAVNSVDAKNDAIDTAAAIPTAEAVADSTAPVTAEAAAEPIAARAAGAVAEGAAEIAAEAAAETADPAAPSAASARSATVAAQPAVPAETFDANAVPSIDLSTAPMTAPLETSVAAAAMSAVTEAVASGADAGNPRQVAGKVLSEMRTLCGTLGEQLEAIDNHDRERRDPTRIALTRMLLACGFSAQLVRLLLGKLPSVSNAEEGLAWIKATFERNLPVLDNEDALMGQGGVFALMGPTGVGKTTTTAKLAARAVMRHGADRVALLTTDSYRIGAHEQLRIYGRILGVAVHAVKDAADLSLVLSELRNKHMVLIDTIGMSQRDRAVSEQVAMLCGTHLPVKRLLLLNATSHGDTLNEVVRAYGAQGQNGQPGLSGCIITKVDESNGIGAALDTVMRHRLPVHYVSNGQKVPEDLRVARRGFLIDKAFSERHRESPFQVDEADIALMFGAEAQGSATSLAGASGEVQYG